MVLFLHGALPFPRGPCRSLCLQNLRAIGESTLFTEACQALLGARSDVDALPPSHRPTFFSSAGTTRGSSCASREKYRRSCAD